MARHDDAVTRGQCTARVRRTQRRQRRYGGHAVPV